MKQCQEELLRKKNLIIQKLQSTKISILDTIKTDPRLRNEEYFNFDFKSKATLLLEADISIQDPAERAENRELEVILQLEELKIEAEKKANEELDRAKKRELEEIKVKRKAKEDREKLMTKSLKIYVAIYDGRTITLEVKLSNTIRDLKSKIQDEAGIPPNHQSLCYYGKPLRDEITLYDYNINTGRTIEMVSRSTNSYFQHNFKLQ